MGKYGKAAVRAVKLVRAGNFASPVPAWQLAVEELFKGLPEAQNNGCPKGAFLGLCEEGWVVGIPPGAYTKSRSNKAIAVAAVRLLKQNPALAIDGDVLWDRVLDGAVQLQNGQMDVVLTLWESDLIAKDHIDEPGGEARLVPIPSSSRYRARRQL